MIDLEPELETFIDSNRGVLGINTTALRAMSHVTEATRDRRRFEKQAGKCLPVIQPAGAACCAKASRA